MLCWDNKYINKRMEHESYNGPKR